MRVSDFYNLDRTQPTLDFVDVDLFIIAEKLSKPIEYFFGEDYSSGELADLIGLVRSQTNKEQKTSVEMVRSIIELKSFMELTEKRGEEPTEEQISSAVKKNCKIC